MDIYQKYARQLAYIAHPEWYSETTFHGDWQEELVFFETVKPLLKKFYEEMKKHE